MKTRLNRIFSLVVAVVMLGTFVPSRVYADSSIITADPVIGETIDADGGQNNSVVKNSQVTTKLDAGAVPVVEFTFNGTDYAVYDGVAGSGDGVSWTCTGTHFKLDFSKGGTFKLSDAYDASATLNLVGGGGGGEAAELGLSGAGGAGGKKTTATISSLAGETLTITIGAGGTGGSGGIAGSAGGYVYCVHCGAGSNHTDAGNGGDTKVVTTTNGTFTAKGGAGGGANNGQSASKSSPTMYWTGSSWAEHSDYVSASSKSGSAGAAETTSKGANGGSGGIAYYWGESDYGNYNSSGYDCLTCGGKQGSPDYGVSGWTKLYQWQSSDVWRSGGSGGTGGGGKGGDTSCPISYHNCNRSTPNGANATGTGAGGGGGALASGLYSTGAVYRHCAQYTGSAMEYYFIGQGGSGSAGAASIEGDVTDLTGTIEITKTIDGKAVSAYTGTFPQFTFTIAGGPDSETFTVTTSSSTGTATKSGLKPGSYTVTENKYDGYVQTTAQTAVVSAGNTTKLTFDNLTKKLNINATKKDKETGTSVQGNATVNGAVYGIYKVSDDSLVSSYEVEDGIFKATGLPMTESYYCQEITAPTGYEKDLTKYLIEIDPAAIASETSEYSLSLSDQILKGYFEITKTDKKTGAFLEGAEFQIINRSSYPVVHNGTTYASGAVIETVTTGSTGKVQTSSFPYGKYEIVETKAPPSYGIGSDNTQTVENYDKITGKINTKTSLSFEDDSIRGDFSFSKKNQAQRLLPNVVFKVVAESSGETHYIVTDENGEFNSSASRYLHSSNTNTNDAAVGSDGKVDETKLNPHAGLWFSGSKTQTGTPDDNTGALPCDTYHVTEISTSANKGLVLLDFDFTVTSENYIIDLGILTDLNPPSIQSVFLSDDSGTHVADVDSNTTLTETVTLHDVVKGQTYTIECVIMDSATGETAKDADGNELTQTKQITPTSTEMDNVKFRFNFDASNMKGKTLVATDYLYCRVGDSDVTVAAHDLDNLAGDELENQTVSFPSLGTLLTDANGGKEILAGTVSLVDTVYYSKLDPTKTYKLTGQLYNTTTKQPVKDSRGVEIKAELIFQPETESGSVKVSFAGIDLSQQAGYSIVCFETLTVNGSSNVVYEHKDFDDADQTVTIPSIATVATNETGNKLICAAPGQKIIDTVYLYGLTPNTEYSLTGTVYNKATEASAGKTETVTFTSEATGNAIVTVNFTDFDASNLAGGEIVIGQELYNGANHVGSHCLMTEVDQTLMVPKISTVALSKDGTKNVAIDSAAKIIDTVTFEKLYPGEQYLLKGHIADLDGNPVQIEGETVEAETTFTAQGESGTVDLTLTFDSEKLPAGVYVVYEELQDENGTVVAVHADKADTDQQFARVAEIKTLATGENGTDKTLTFTDYTVPLKIKDIITYKGLTPGEEYTVSSTLMDAGTGKVITVEEDKPCAMTTTFTPAAADGTTEVTFSVMPAYIEAKSVVCYERISINGMVIGIHEDLGDADQTVEIYTLAQIFKYDASTEKAVAGAVITVTDKTTSQTSEATTGEDGYIRFSAVPGHTYEYKEKTAPTGYVLNDKSYAFVVDAETGEITGDTSLPNVKAGSVTIIKLDAITKLPVMNAEITIRDSKNNALLVQTTDKEGKVYFKPTAAGEYTYQETKAPDGWYLNTDKYMFSVKSDMTVSGTLTFYDAPYGTIVLTKTSSTGARLPGATLAIYNSSGTLLGRGVTDSDGKVYFVSPGAGTYYFLEQAAPKGYVRNTQTFHFSINDKNVISGTTTIVNQADPSPQTGDEEHLAFWTVSAFAGTLIAAGAAYLLMKRKRAQRGN